MLAASIRTKSARTKLEREMISDINDVMIQRETMHLAPQMMTMLAGMVMHGLIANCIYIDFYIQARDCKSDCLIYFYKVWVKFYHQYILLVESTFIKILLFLHQNIELPFLAYQITDICLFQVTEFREKRLRQEASVENISMSKFTKVYLPCTITVSKTGSNRVADVLLFLSMCIEHVASLIRLKGMNGWIEKCEVFVEGANLHANMVDYILGANVVVNDADMSRVKAKINILDYMLRIY